MKSSDGSDGQRTAPMKISIPDRSLYYKGLMILVRRDREIHEKEKKFMMSIGKKLGFDRKFCAKTMEDILVNHYITDEPPRFSKAVVARSFLLDGLKLSAADGQIHEAEISWLTSVAKQNGLADFWNEELVKFRSSPPAGISGDHFEVTKFQW